MIQGISCNSELSVKCSARITEKYFATLKRCAESATETSGDVIEEGLTYLTRICKGVTLSFLCTQKSCAFFGCNASWVKRKASYHFRCPACGVQYQPFSMDGA